MPTFDPPINKRSTEDLVSIAHGSDEEWQIEAIELAKAELSARNISLETQYGIIAKWKEKDRKFDEQFQEWLENNQYEKYTVWEIVKVLFSAPLILTGQVFVGDSLTELKHLNYKIKFKQRILLLFGGVLIWVCFVFGSVKIAEIQFMKEIEEVDISEWEENRIVIEPNE